jgi:hypothetical protein
MEGTFVFLLDGYYLSQQTGGLPGPQKKVVWHSASTSHTFHVLLYKLLPSLNVKRPASVTREDKTSFNYVFRIQALREHV